jgi:hypothetical protein
MGYRHLTNEELINQATAEILSEDSNVMEVHKDLLNELVERFERVLLSQSSLLKAGRNSKDPNQLDLF